MKMTITVELERDDGPHTSSLSTFIPDDILVGDDAAIELAALSSSAAMKVGTEVVRIVGHRCAKTDWAPPGAQMVWVEVDDDPVEEAAEPVDGILHVPGDARN